MRRFLVFAAVFAAACCVAGCAPNGHEPTVSPSITSQNEAQQILYGYMQKTLKALPFDVTLDNARYGKGGGAGVGECEDRIDLENSPFRYYDMRDMHVPAGTDFNDLIAKMGDIWRSWGWKVEERSGVRKPNQRATSPEGYNLDIMAQLAEFASYPPAFEGTTPCMPPGLKQEHYRVPVVITKDKLLYDDPSATPTN